MDDEAAFGDETDGESPTRFEGWPISEPLNRRAETNVKTDVAAMATPTIRNESVASAAKAMVKPPVPVARVDAVARLSKLCLIGRRRLDRDLRETAVLHLI